ncbi:hypothetical protein [Cysteiniphilum sp. 6C5]|uniref:hypothetical protein n=1 Tax=unclassified Cysteiniphilum TaxID=2610889 RepID=UPI003F8332D5
MIKVTSLFHTLFTLLIFSFSFGYAAADKYITRAGSNAITLDIGDKPVGFYQINNIVIDNPNFSVSAINNCEFLEKQCIIDIDVAAEAASQSANLTYQLTDLLTGQLSQESMTLETAPVMNHISSANAYYDYSTEHYLVARGNQVTFDIEVIGGFPWVDADISISNTEAVEILEHNCTGTIEVKQSCQVIARVSDTTEALYADLNIINSFPSHKTLEIENGLLSRVTQLSTGMLKIDFIALQDVQGINLIGLNDDKWSVNTNIANGCAVSGGMALNAGESCSIQLLQHPVYRYFTTGTYPKEMTIPTSIGDFSMTVNLEGQLAIPDKTTNQLFMYKVNGNELSFEREIPLSVPVGHMLANPFGYLYVTDADNGDIYRYNLLHDNIEKVYNSEGAHGISSLVLRESIFLNNAYNLHVIYEDGTLLQLRESIHFDAPEISTYNLGYADSFYHVSRSNQSNNTVYLTRSSMTGMAAIQTINLTSPLVTTTDDQIATNLIGASSIFRSNNRYFGLDSDSRYYRRSSITLGRGRQLDFASDHSKDIQLGLDVASGLDVLIAPAKGGGIMTFDKNASQPSWQRNRNAKEKDDFGDTTAILPSDNYKVFAFSRSEITEAVSVFECRYTGTCIYKASYKSMDGFKMPADANDEAMTVIQFLSATQLRPVV